MRNSLLLLVALTVTGMVSYGQLRVGPKHSRLIIPERMEFIVDSPTLEVDTLIMDDHSSLRFTYPDNQIVVHHARIGKDCKWMGNGPLPGISSSVNYSTNGASMDVEIYFSTLGRLTIDLRGAMGLRGSPGVPGARGVDGSMGQADGGNGGEGGPGGPGGNGGDITFRYKSFDGPIEFGNAKKNAVVIKVDGGSGGAGGAGGPGGEGGMMTRKILQSPTPVVEVDGRRGSPGRPGIPGPSGSDGEKGRMKLVEIK